MGTSSTQGELWGAASHDWAMLTEPQHRPLWEAMLDAAPVTSGTRFLDAGCGGGGSSVLAAERGAQVSGLDAAAEMIQIAAERVPGGDFRTGRIEELPYDDGTFDAVFAANCVQFAADPVATLHEFARVCRPEGRIVAGLLGSPERVAFHTIFAAVRDVLPEPPAGARPFDLSAPGKLKSLFAEAGLNVLGGGEAACPYNYPDFETFWRASAAGGPFMGAVRAIGEESARKVVRQAVEPFIQDDGQITMRPNVFKYVLGTRAGDALTNGR